MAQMTAPLEALSLMVPMPYESMPYEPSERNVVVRSWESVRLFTVVLSVSQSWIWM